MNLMQKIKGCSGLLSGKVLVVLGVLVFAWPALGAVDTHRQIKPLPAETLKDVQQKSRVKAPETRVKPPIKVSVPVGHVSVDDLPPPEADSHNWEMKKWCSENTTRCALKYQHSFLMPGYTLNHLKNISPDVILWFPYPGSSMAEAPSNTRGFLLYPGATLNPTLIGLPLNMSLSTHFTLWAVPVCNNNGQLYYCEYDNAFVRMFFNSPS